MLSMWSNLYLQQVYVEFKSFPFPCTQTRTKKSVYSKLTFNEHLWAVVEFSSHYL